MARKKTMVNKPYRPKIVLGKRQYRSGPTEKQMLKTVTHNPSTTKQGKNQYHLRIKRARARRVKQVQMKLGS